MPLGKATDKDFHGKLGKDGKLDKEGLCTLAQLNPGESGIIHKINADSALRRKLAALGFVKGVEVSLEHTAPMGDPRAYSLIGYQLSLRNEDAEKIILRAAL